MIGGEIISLVITPVSGSPIHLDCLGVSEPRQAKAPGRWTGLQAHPQLTFYFDAYIRALLPELAPHAGINVQQVANRKRVQLTSDKPCSFVRFRWDAARVRGYAVGWNPDSSHTEVTGVFAVTQAVVEGLAETTALTLFRGDWYWNGEQAINFETGASGSSGSGGSNNGGGEVQT